MIQRWYAFSQRPDARSHVAFIADYDLLLAEQLVAGIDVWINTPRRPWEASGTSGMKVLVNGGLNLSELDGWWAEAYTPKVGWAIGDGGEHGDDPPSGMQRRPTASMRCWKTRSSRCSIRARRTASRPTGWSACVRAWRR